MKDIKVGDKMWIGSCFFTTNVEDLQEVPVSKVGGKYVTIWRHGREIQFHVDTLKRKSEYSTDQKLFFSVEEYEIQKNFNDKVEKVRDGVLKLNASKLKSWNDEDLDTLLEILKKY